MKYGVLRKLPRDLYLASGARAASILGNVVAVTALLLDFLDHGAGAWAVAGLLAAGALPIVLLAPLAGSVVDLFDSRSLIIVSSLWQALACGLLAFVSGSPQMALPLVAMNACGTAVTNPLFLALVSMMVSNDRMAPANSVQQGAVTIATMAGPAVGGLVYGVTGGAQVPLLLDAVIFVVIAATSGLITTRRRPTSSEPSWSIRTSITVLFSDPAQAAVVALAVLLPVVVHLIYVAQVFLVRDTFGASALTFGLLQATHTVGLLIGAVLASRLDSVRRIVFGTPVAAAAMSLAIAQIGLVGSLPLVFMLYVFAGICMSMVSVSMGTLLLLRTPESIIGRVMASFTAVHRTSGLVAYGVGGVVVGLVHPQMVYVLSGFSALVIVAGLLPAFRKAWVVVNA